MSIQFHGRDCLEAARKEHTSVFDSMNNRNAVVLSLISGVATIFYLTGYSIWMYFVLSYSSYHEVFFAS